MSSTPYRLVCRAHALCLGLLGAVLLLGGYKLLVVGGSPWYAGAGAALLACAALLWSGHRWGAWLYGLLMAVTVVWALGEAGLNGWALFPRLALLALLGAWLLTPWSVASLTLGPRPLLGQRRTALAWGSAWVVLVVLVWRAGAATPEGSAHAQPSPPALVAAPDEAQVDADWRHYGNDAEGTRFSPLAEINAGNVQRLRLAWRFDTGDHARPGQEYNFEATPLKVRNTLYTCSPSGQVFALAAATGKLLWHFDAHDRHAGPGIFTCRGVAYFEAGAATEPCAARVYVVTPDQRLWSLDARDGRPCAAFGHAGAVDLLAGLGAVPPGSYAVTSPPLVTHGMLVVGARITDNLSTDMPSGVVRSFDAQSGKLAWAWDIGRPGQQGEPAGGEIYTRSTPNAWGPMVADEARGIVYLTTGNPAADFWGGHRREFDHSYGVSLVALDVASGRERWHFQATHHDVWDNDLGSQPVLLDLPDGRDLQPAILVGSKQGDVFVLNRLTGAPIVPVVERAVPGRSDIGEQLSPTQPHSALALNPGPERLSEALMWGLTPVDQMWCRIQFRRARYQGPYTPPGIGQPSIMYPGMFGGIEWSGISVDPVHRVLLANPNAMPFIVRMAPAKGAPAGLTETLGTGYAASFFGFMSPLNVPCLQPPWGKLYAVDLNATRIRWERTVGTTRDIGVLGVHSHLPLRIGTPQVGGTMLTAGGLVFMSATLDQALRAYTVADGAELWSARLPAGGQATPMSYSVGHRQYVVIAAGGHAVLGTRAGDSLLAYTLDGTSLSP